MLCHRQLFVYHCLGLNKSILREFEMNKTTDQITKELSRPGYLNLCGLYRKLNTSIVHRHLKLERRGLLIDKCLRLIPKYMQSMIFYIIFTSKYLFSKTSKLILSDVTLISPRSSGLFVMPRDSVTWHGIT